MLSLTFKILYLHLEATLPWAVLPEHLRYFLISFAISLRIGGLSFKC
jgi:hypothetical protein